MQKMEDFSVVFQSFRTYLLESIKQEAFCKVSLGNYKGELIELKNISVKIIDLKKGTHLSFTFRYKTRDEVKNYTINEGISEIENFLTTGFLAANLFTTNADYNFEKINTVRWRLRKLPATIKEAPSKIHDIKKQRIIDTHAKPYLVKLNVTDATGHVLKHAQDKYRQINHYVEILRPLFEAIPTETPLKIVDMGSGKGYLTFAIYDYLKYILKRNVYVVGVEIRNDLVSFCNTLASENKFNGLSFSKGTIQDYSDTNFNSIIALHACDTATDDAIARGIHNQAELIVVAPCCHKQIRNEMGKTNINNTMQSLLAHGIFMERQAEMVTDTLRSLYLELHNYKTKVFEFVTDVHTPKNIMITAIKRKQAIDTTNIQKQINELKTFFGIQTHYLETLL
jgi:hypothetical protein